MIKQHIKEAYHVSDDRIELIRRGVDENIFNPESVSQDRIQALREKWNITDNKFPIIMIPARLTRLKGHKVFIKSLSMLKKQEWIGLCVGDINEKSAYYAELMEYSHQSGVENKIHFVGHCEDMPAAMKLADIVVSSSIKPESSGRIAFEAQAMGTPVVASAHGGSLESILNDKTGFLVKPGDPESMAEALDILISDKAKCAQMGEDARKWVKENFTINMMCEKTLHLYHELLKNRV